MTQMLSGVSVFVSFILGFLIIYASRFLIKRRNKEFGIYLTLGMSKRKISMILFLETILIGIISLFVGLGLGIVLSQFMSLLVANMFEADLTNFTFTFSLSSCIKTLIYFSVMYILVMIFNTIMISKCKLIDLLRAHKKSEKIHMKNPYLCILVFIIGIAMLSRAYYIVTSRIDLLQEVKMVLIPISLGAISTFLIFWSLSGLILKIVMSLKTIYYKGLNSFVLRQISSKINTTVMSITVICLMLFITICVLSSSLSIKNSMTKNLKTLAPLDVEFSKTYDITEESVKKSWRLTTKMIEDSKISLRETLSKLDFNVDDNIKDYYEYDTYATHDLKFKDTLGSYYEEISQKFPLMEYSGIETIIKLSDYNQLARMLGNEEISLNTHEYAVVADHKEFIEFRNEALKRKTPIKLLGKTYLPKYDSCLNGAINLASTHINTGVFVVPDEAVDSSIRETGNLLGNYSALDDDEKKIIEEKIMLLSKHPYGKSTSLDINTKLALYENSVGLGAMVTFIGLYLGIIFLISSAAILALKELSESADNKERFRMLRKLGADEKDINRALFKQIAIFFTFPLILAIVHSIFGIKFCNFILSSFGNEQLLGSIIMTSIFIVIIYGGYFIITYLCSKNIIKEKI